MTRTLFIIAVALLSLSMLPAKAATATFTAPQPNPGDVVGAPDNQGVIVPVGATVGLVFDETFAAGAGDSITVFRTLTTLANATFSFGVYNGGAPTIVHSVTGVLFGASFNRGGAGALSGCSAFGGCDYLEITTNAAFFGAPGFGLDAVSFNNAAATPAFLTGAFNPVAAASPEPSVWLMMIMAFAIVGWRLKIERRRQPQRRFAIAPAAL